MQTSRLTVRLPDLTSPRPRPAAPSPDRIDSRDDDEANQAPWQEATEYEDDAAAPTFLARVYRFVGQPKFWLACLTAIAVQVILALVFTPAAKPTAAPRTRRKAATAAPPQRTGVARIVVPPAESPATASAAATSANDILAAPQMQPTPPVDAAVPWEPLPPTSADPSEGADASGQAPGSPRLAEQKRLADDQQYDGRAAQESLGARLEGLMPIDDVEHDEPNGGSGR